MTPLPQPLPAPGVSEHLDLLRRLAAADGVYGPIALANGAVALDCDCDIGMCPDAPSCFGFGDPHPFTPRKEKGDPGEGRRANKVDDGE